MHAACYQIGNVLFLIEEIVVRSLISVPILAVAFAASLLVASPATAAPYGSGDVVDIGDYSWQVEGYPFGVLETQFNDGTNSFDNAWDDGISSGAYFSIFDDFGPSWNLFTCTGGDLSAPDTNGDVVITCDVNNTDIGLLIEGDIRLYGEGDLARHVYTVSNPTSSAIEYSWEYYIEFGETELRATTAQPTLANNGYVDSDFWAYNFSPLTLNSLSVWGQPDSAINHERVSSDRDHQLWAWNDGDDGSQLVLDPGASSTYVFFQKVDLPGTIATRDSLGSSATSDPVDGSVASEPAANPASDATVRVEGNVGFEFRPANAAAIQGALAEFAVFDGRLSRGLPAGVEVANWKLPVAAPELAETGSDDTAGLIVLILGGALVALGFAFQSISLRRRVSLITSDSAVS